MYFILNLSLPIHVAYVSWKKALPSSLLHIQRLSKNNAVTGEPDQKPGGL